MNKQGKGKIEYLDYTFNPVTGCLHGCDYCYARDITKRFGGGDCLNEWGLKEMPKFTGKGYVLDTPMYKQTKARKMVMDPYPFGFAPTFHRYRLNELLQAKKPSIIGVVYMGDIGGRWVPQEWFNEVMDTCFKVSRHKYIFLTKDPENLRNLFGNWRWESGLTGQIFDDFSKQLWFGTTIENQQAANKRIFPLQNIPGVNTFLSVEPLQGPINLNRIEPEGKDAFLDVLKGTAAVPFTVIDNRPKIKWVIVGEETGLGAVPPKPKWVQSIIDQCRAAGVPVFIKRPLYDYCYADTSDNTLKYPFRLQEWPEGLR
jgi:protein gp37